MKEENGTIIEFLCGEKPFDGVWFSEKHPTENGAFWWRKHLRNYEASRESRQLSAVPSAIELLDKEEDYLGNCAQDSEGTMDIAFEINAIRYCRLILQRGIAG